MTAEWNNQEHTELAWTSKGGHRWSGIIAAKSQGRIDVDHGGEIPDLCAQWIANGGVPAEYVPPEAVVSDIPQGATIVVQRIDGKSSPVNLDPIHQGLAELAQHIEDIKTAPKPEPIDMTDILARLAASEAKAEALQRQVDGHSQTFKALGEIDLAKPA